MSPTFETIRDRSYRLARVLTWAGRLASMVWMFGGVFFIAFFTAMLTSSFTAVRLQQSVDGPEDLALVGALTLANPIGPQAQTVDEFGSPRLKGAGSTFAHPLMLAWARDYRTFRHGSVAVPAAGGARRRDRRRRARR